MDCGLGVLVFPTESGSAAMGVSLWYFVLLSILYTWFYKIFGALAVPLELPHRNVFISYNFEANYNLPYIAENIIPGPLEKFEGWYNGLFDKDYRRSYGKSRYSSELEDEDEGYTTEVTVSVTEDSKKSKRSLISRRNFYSVLHEKFKW